METSSTIQVFWEVLEEYAGEKQGFYRLLGVDGSIEIRICTGRLGFKKEFECGKDERKVKAAKNS
jgi:hypothetical protein